MTIFIDINHPAHVHYFKEFILEMSRRGHTILVSNRRDYMIDYLLDFYNISHFTRNTRPSQKGKWHSLYYLFKAIWSNYIFLKGKQVDIFLGFASVPAGMIGFIRRKPVILLDDTEHNRVNQAIYQRLVTDLITPYYFQKEILNKQIFIQAFIESFYINDRFNFHDPERDESSSIICRFSSFDASHDRVVNLEELLQHRRDLLNLLRAKHKVVLVTDDRMLKAEYANLLPSFSPDQIHVAIRGSAFVISDGATLASEAGLMGVPYVYTNPLRVGYIEEQVRLFAWAHQMSYKELLANHGELFESLPRQKNSSMPMPSKYFIDPSSYLIDFVETYPSMAKAHRGTLVTSESYHPKE